MQTYWLTQKLQQLLRPKPTAIFEAWAIGIVSALAAVALRQSIDSLSRWRVGLVDLHPAWIVLPILGIVGGGLSGLLVERLAPEAAGSGIPQVKAALGYVPIALDLRVAAVKWLSTCLSLGAGLALGRQGPTVQIGAALAAQLSHWRDTSPTYQRQLIAAGAAAGLAASFNAPIAGVLFVVEELLQDGSDLTLSTAIIAAVVGGVIAHSIGGRAMIPDLSQIPIDFSVQEIPILIGVGILAGLLGVWCNRSLIASLKFYQQRLPGRSLAVKVAIAGGVTGAISLLLPPTLLDSRNLQDFAIIGDINWQISVGILLTQFVMFVVGFGSTAPGGLFAPSLILGAALGDVVATGLQSLYQSGILPINLVVSSPTLYALTGMSAVFSAITHRPIIAISIVLEMSAQFDLALPLMIGSISAYLIAEKFFPGSIYQHLLIGRGINLDHGDLADHGWASLTAADIMERRVETLSSQMTIEAAIQAFAHSHHRGFPIVDGGKLVGILTQSDVSAFGKQSWDNYTPIAELMTRRVVTVNPQDPLTSVLHLLDGGAARNEHRQRIGRLPVVDGQKLVGIITRADIIRVEAERVSSTVSPLKIRSQPSYLVYQTRSPATGRGRLLVPLSNPQTADILLRLAAEIALKHHYELECLHVISIPHASTPAETPVDMTASVKLMEWATERGQIWGIPVHTQIRVAHRPADTILETISERHINLLCLGWQGSSATPSRIFGNTIDTAILEASCDVVLVKLGENLLVDAQNSEYLTQNAALTALMRLNHLDRWLVPISGGANAEYALELLPALTALSRELEIHLCQVFAASESPPDLSSLHAAADFVSRTLDIQAIVTPLYGEDIAQTAIDFAADKGCQGIILGASREGLLSQTIHGNLPEAIARGSNCTVIVVRRAI
jgi:chloride channel protein, CIC family